ncbi:hypothetical protein [Candidatus Nitrosocosmicus arcticus]|uniref:hypothetical protein n=1 Tax=Candidatus Nitrosocosmicus arcticus TaxID=2035267 RepID=UPI00119F3576|nr:hypothetical protein [Candidatus Nitrosocosmicus arcticus]
MFSDCTFNVWRCTNRYLRNIDTAISNISSHALEFAHNNQLNGGCVFIFFGDPVHLENTFITILSKKANFFLTLGFNGAYTDITNILPENGPTQDLKVRIDKVIHCEYELYGETIAFVSVLFTFFEWQIPTCNMPVLVETKVIEFDGRWLYLKQLSVGNYRCLWKRISFNCHSEMNYSRCSIV